VLRERGGRHGRGTARLCGFDVVAGALRRALGVRAVSGWSLRDSVGRRRAHSSPEPLGENTTTIGRADEQPGCARARESEQSGESMIRKATDVMPEPAMLPGRRPPCGGCGPADFRKRIPGSPAAEPLRCLPPASSCSCKSLRPDRTHRRILVEPAGWTEVCERPTDRPAWSAARPRTKRGANVVNGALAASGRCAGSPGSRQSFAGESLSEAGGVAGCTSPAEQPTAVRG
jgi:hypothetical protein